MTELMDRIAKELDEQTPDEWLLADFDSRERKDALDGRRYYQSHGGNYTQPLLRIYEEVAENGLLSFSAFPYSHDAAFFHAGPNDHRGEESIAIIPFQVPSADFCHVMGYRIEVTYLTECTCSYSVVSVDDDVLIDSAVARCDATWLFDADPSQWPAYITDKREPSEPKPERPRFTYVRPAFPPVPFDIETTIMVRFS